MNMRSGKVLEPCRIVMLGQPGVGKSALVVRFLTKRFIWEYDPTLEIANKNSQFRNRFLNNLFNDTKPLYIECTYKHQTSVDEEMAALEILDTAGQDGNTHSEGHVRWGEGFMLVYSVTDRESFHDVLSLKKYLDEVRKPRNVCCVIVGNKADLKYERRVATEEGEKLASDLACAFYETSACLGGAEIDEAFQELFREVRRRKAVEGKPRRRSSAAQVKQVLNKMFKIQNG